MPSARVSELTRELLRRLAEESGESMRAILDKAVQAYRRQRLLALAAWRAAGEPEPAFAEDLERVGAEDRPPEDAWAS